MYDQDVSVCLAITLHNQLHKLCVVCSSFKYKKMNAHFIKTFNLNKQQRTVNYATAKRRALNVF